MNANEDMKHEGNPGTFPLAPQWEAVPFERRAEVLFAVEQVADMLCNSADAYLADEESEVCRTWDARGSFDEVLPALSVISSVILISLLLFGTSIFRQRLHAMPSCTSCVAYMVLP